MYFILGYQSKGAEYIYMPNFSEFYFQKKTKQKHIISFYFTIIHYSVLVYPIKSPPKYI